MGTEKVRYFRREDMKNDNLRTQIRETMISVYGESLKDNGKASKMADAVFKRVQRHVKKQFKIGSSV